MPQYTIKHVEQREAFSSQYGTMQVYALVLDGYNGQVLMNQKATSPAPQIGTVLEGDITRDSRGNPKFKKAYTPQGGGNSTYGAGPSNYGGGSNASSKKDNGEGMAWGNSLTNAVTLHSALIGRLSAKDVIDTDELEAKVLATAMTFFENRPGNETKTEDVPTAAPSGDVVPIDISDHNPIDLDSIPF